MNFLIFGPEPPKLSFRHHPAKGTVIRCDNKYVLDYNPHRIITWGDIGERLELPSCRALATDERNFERYEVARHEVIEELKGLCQTNIEKIFFDKFTSAQKDWVREERLVIGPPETLSDVDLKREEKELPKHYLQAGALIPQVWVNWIHYDFRDKKRAEKTHLEPFRVDFLYHGHGVFRGGGPVIVEIDDIWHIADIEKYVDRFMKSPEPRPSLGKFTEHLRKDRWLRHHGWEVCRFSTLEVEKEDPDYLYFETLGEWEVISIPPTYFPHKE